MDLSSAYREMVRIRMFEERVLECAAAGLVPGSVHPYTGQEAVAVGVLAARRPDEWVASFYRCHGHALAAGVSATGLLREILGRAGGVCGGKAGSMHIADRSRHLLGASSIVAAQLPIAAGAAMAEKAAGAGRAVIAFCGDGAFGAGVTYETLTVAALHGLPLLLVCEENGWQDHTRSDLVRHRTPALIAQGLGLDCAEVDGNDVTAVHDAADTALRRCRAGVPQVVVAHTYLRHFHAQLGSQPPAEYRPADERDHWFARDPLVLAESALADSVLAESALAASGPADPTVAASGPADPTRGAAAAIRADVAREMADVFADALGADPPDPATATTAVTTVAWPEHAVRPEPGGSPQRAASPEPVG
ncbi:thiamine pyrophosphate-dependent dehydrogenase E1 component subunit alpha [Solwaraspora sp. WMMD406]|uniref:thiamine pyrophosphate-dependent dehydrogenase E1 component subunit alpha n=1 Tax=Solwaraspora sp. WMMD406 TaxID=3016095 RepID=UPI0024162F7F|nr:thiamine pyrophosphate-dependent dehydrogenase E1 component subunit alpha [Solwaraspora sp. WMMD406]MDG4765943.1 thiamine pyrophosphate-dependent dehydrogenase E1 component subunit alpha [Solwaraspora sp. WMMD406]